MNRLNVLLMMPWVAATKCARVFAVLFVLPGLGKEVST